MAQLSPVDQNLLIIEDS